MNILVACEESQTVCRAFRKYGFNAFSADLLECSGGHPEWHIKGDVLPLLNGNCSFNTMDGALHTINELWDFILAFPPCTDLANSGARHFKRKQADGTQEKSKIFFLEFTKAKCKRIVIENPVGIMSTYYRKPDQIIQPWQYGDNYQKTTCLWFIGDIPALKPIIDIKPEFNYHYWVDKNGKLKRQTEWYYNTRKQGKNRGKIASKTPQGVANAMALQWGEYITHNTL